MARCARNGEELGADKVTINGLDYCPKCAREIEEEEKRKKEKEEEWTRINQNALEERLRVANLIVEEQKRDKKRSKKYDGPQL